MTTRKTKPKIEPYEGNMCVIKFDYGTEIILPYDDGITLLKCLEKAETLKDNYESGKAIEPINFRQFTMTPLSIEEYRKIKMDQLLGITNE